MDKRITCCRICPSLCGIVVTVADGAITRIAPDKENPHTWRDFCPRGRTANDMVEHPQRILHPMRREGDRYVQATWAEAIGDIAARLSAIVASGGPDALGVYWGNPAGLSGSTPVFLSGFLDGVGTRNRYYVGSIDENNSHVVAQEMYNAPLTMLIADVDHSSCFLLVGTNPAVSGIGWTFGFVPDGWRRLLAARERGAKLIVVDPVRTKTADSADLHIAIRPGEDWALLLAMIKVIIDRDLLDSAACAATNGFEALRELVAVADVEDLARRCDVDVQVITEAAETFARAPSAMCLAATGVSQTLNGTIGEWLAHVLNVITGGIDKPGGRRYERGYLNAGALWDRMASKAEGRSRVRGFPIVQGHMPLATMAEDITVPGEGQIRAVMLVAGNPVISGPSGAALDAAFASVDLLVAIDVVQRESHRHAHWLLPAAHWLERDDLLALLSQAHDQPYAFFAPKVVERPEDVREEWEIFVDLALRMRVPLFGRRGVNLLVRITRQLARITGRPGLAFSPRWIDRALVAIGRRVRFKEILAHPHGLVFGKPEYGNFAKYGLRTPDKRIHVAPGAFVAETRALLRAPASVQPPDFPLLLCNERHREGMNSWLNDLPGLHKGRKKNDLKISPADAEELGISHGNYVRVTSAWGSIEVVATISDRIRAGVVVAAHGWGSRVFDPHTGAAKAEFGVNRNLLVGNEALDRFSGTPALNQTPVRVEPIEDGRVCGRGSRADRPANDERS
jgi:formate dehydrogenase